VFLSSILFVAASHRCTAEETIERLLEIEAKIQQVVSKVMPSVVAVTDGQGFGSGVVVNRDGLVLTAGHVMASPFKDDYEVIFPDGSVRKARPLGKNLNVDAGMVQIIEPGPFPYVDLSKGDEAVGDWIITLGHSGGYDIGRRPPVRTGRILTVRDHQFITDAVLIGGDSGGPLFNLSGEVVAIHSSIGDSIAENRHTTINTFRQHWTRMASGETWGTLPELSNAKSKKKSTTSRARMGVIVDHTAANARVKDVHPGSPADRAGIRNGDVVTRLDGQPVHNSQQLIDRIKTMRVGQDVSLEILRNGSYFTLQLKLEGF
jgi:serine protease Do